MNKINYYSTQYCNIESGLIILFLLNKKKKKILKRYTQDKNESIYSRYK